MFDRGELQLSANNVAEYNNIIIYNNNILHYGVRTRKKMYK